MEQYDLEAVYDNQIAPLVAELIKICQEHNMPMLASFAFRGCNNGGHDCCTTALLSDVNRSPASMIKAAWVLL